MGRPDHAGGGGEQEAAQTMPRLRTPARSRRRWAVPCGRCRRGPPRIRVLLSVRVGSPNGVAGSKVSVDVQERDDLRADEVDEFVGG